MPDEEIIKEEEVVEDLVSDETGEEETSTPDETEETKPEEDAMGETVKNLEREISGLKKGISSERGKRQKVEGKLEQFGQIFNESRAAKEEPTKQEKIPIEFDDDGNPFVSPEVVAKLNMQETQQLRDRLLSMESYLTYRAQQSSAQQNLARAVEPGDVAVHNKLKAGYARVDEMLAEYIQTTGHGPLNTFDQALDLMEQAGIDKQFEKEFPGLDLEATVEAFSSPRKLKRAISMAKSKDVPAGDSSKDTVIKMGKLGISSHVGRSGTPGGNELTLDQIAGLSQRDFDRLSEDQMKKIDRILEGEER